MSRFNTNTNEEAFDYLFKIVVIGDCGIGKTSLVQRFKSGGFTDRYTNTIGVDFAMKTVIVDGKRVKVSIKFIPLDRS
jgi:Ras-related protein Rab-43